MRIAPQTEMKPCEGMANYIDRLCDAINLDQRIEFVELCAWFMFHEKAPNTHFMIRPTSTEEQLIMDAVSHTTALVFDVGQKQMGESYENITLARLAQARSAGIDREVCKSGGRQCLKQYGLTKCVNGIGK